MSASTPRPKGPGRGNQKQRHPFQSFSKNELTDMQLEDVDILVFCCDRQSVCLHIQESTLNPERSKFRHLFLTCFRWFLQQPCGKFSRERLEARRGKLKYMALPPAGASGMNRKGSVVWSNRPFTLFPSENILILEQQKKKKKAYRACAQRRQAWPTMHFYPLPPHFSPFIMMAFDRESKTISNRERCKCLQSLLTSQRIFKK